MTNRVESTLLILMTKNKTIEVNGLQVFYREAGNPSSPAILLLHGFPTSSHMFRELIPKLAETNHVLAPDLPGFGFSESPPRNEFKYAFENLAGVIGAFIEKLRLKRFAIYIFDYGAPVGLRLALAHPERISHGVADTSLIAPESYTLDSALLARPGNDEIQLDLFLDYASNVALYPKFQAFFRQNRPPLLAVWGQNDPFFLPAGAKAFARDNPNAEVHFFDTGHFALETHASEIAAKIQAFLKRVNG
jgi:pimeloyl-ACP methyl ester carboxylesterase